ncbi:hypothetical protein GW17_00060035, partial [Ensete ventricosum]
RWSLLRIRSTHSKSTLPPIVFFAFRGAHCSSATIGGESMDGVADAPPDPRLRRIATALQVEKRPREAIKYDVGASVVPYGSARGILQRVPTEKVTPVDGAHPLVDRLRVLVAFWTSSHSLTRLSYSPLRCPVLGFSHGPAGGVRVGPSRFLPYEAATEL